MTKARNLAALGSIVSVTVFGARGDGVTDDTAAIQAAINSNPGRLFFPPGVYSVTPGVLGHALLADSVTIEMFGKGATIFMPSTGNYQALRMANCARSTLRGLRFQGSGTNGSNGGQGLVQIYQGSHFTADDCDFDDANCDGLAVAAVAGVAVVNCRSDNAAKAALYVNNSTNVRVTGCLAKNFGGHTVGGSIVGVGIQLSGNTNLVAGKNTVHSGVGVGILCENSGANIPINNLIDANSIYSVSNPTNVAVSCGIRLQNDQATKNCGTIVTNNQVRACGLYSIYAENHNGITVCSNTGIESVNGNIVIGTVVGGTVSNNTLLNTQTSLGGGQFAIALINGATGVVGSGNRAHTVAGFSASTGANQISDTSSGANQVTLAGGLFSATAAQIASLTSTVNTIDKSPGKKVYDTTNHRVMVADAYSPSSNWYVADGSASVTPV